MLQVNKFKGRRRIELDISKKDFLSNPAYWLKRLMGKAKSIHDSNVIEMNLIENELLENSSIFTKNREDGKNINNKFTENHLYRIWKSKVSYIVGKPIQYANSEGDAENDDMQYFNKYINESGKQMNDVLVYGDVLEYGVGYRMAYGKIEDVNLETQSPIYDYYLDPREVFVAYSSNFKKEVLFTCVIEKYQEDNKTRTRYTIYYNDFSNHCYSIRLKADFSVFVENMIIEEQREVWDYNPIIEYSLPKRIGIVELLLSLQTSLNYLISLEFDDIEQFIQAYLVFINNDIDLETEEGKLAWKNTIDLINTTRTINLKSIDAQMPADLKMLTNSLDHNSIISLKESIKSAMYGIGGSALPNQSATSGADTSVARTMSNGYQTALFDADLDTTFLKKAEREWINILLQESSTRANNKLENIETSSIEIKYNVNMSDNMLVKAQAIQYLFNSQMPPELILQAIPLLSDVYGSSKKWMDYINELKEKENNNTENKELTNGSIEDIINKGNSMI